MKVFLFAVTLVIVQELVAGQCGEKVKKAAKCVERARLDKKAGLLKSNKAKLEKDIKGCFKKAGCEAPTSGGADDASDPGSANSVPEQTLNIMEKFGFKFMGLTDANRPKVLESMTQCYDKSQASMKPGVEKCVQGKAKRLGDFAFADFIAELDEDEKGNDEDTRVGTKNLLKFMQATKYKGVRAMEPGNEKGALIKRAQQLASAVSDACPSKKSRREARKCIEKVVKKAIPGKTRCKSPIEIMFARSDKHEQFCEKRVKCFADFDDCKEAKEKLWGYVCECAAEEMENSMDQLQDQYQKCVNEGSGITLKDPQEKMKKKALGSFGVGAMRAMCDQEAGAEPYEPCDPALAGEPEEKSGEKSKEESKEKSKEKSKKGGGRGGKGGRGRGKGGRGGRGN